MEISGSFTFHSVGQGLFYSGIINIGGVQRHIVYDCGSFFEKGLLQHEIDKAFDDNDTIDILVISHMDKDHISGIRYLLDRVKQVRFFLMPYMEPEEMIFYAMKYESSRGHHEDYIDTILNFEDVVRNEKIQNVVMLTESEGDGDPIVFGGDVDDDISFKFYRNSEKQDIIDRLLQEKRILVARYDGFLEFPMAWKFRFYVQDDEHSDRKKFHDSLAGHDIKISSFHDIRKIWESTEQLARLKAAYKDVKKDLNLTSLVLLHKPLGGNEEPLFTAVSQHNFCRGIMFSPLCCARIGKYAGYHATNTLLLGDARLRSKAACEKIKSCFSSDLEDCGIALVPHHGSKNNWRKGLLKYVSSDFWVVSFGVHGKYGHPNTEVLKDFGRSWKYAHGCGANKLKVFPRLLFCDEYQAVKYKIKAYKG